MSRQVSTIVTTGQEGEPVALCGLELIGISPADVDAAVLPLLCEEVSRRMGELLGAMEVLEDGRWLELCHTGWPHAEEPWRSHLEVSLFAGAQGPDEETARRRAAWVMRQVMAALPEDLGLYEMEPVCDDQRLHRLWAPFTAAHRLDLRRRITHRQGGAPLVFPLSHGGAPGRFVAPARSLLRAPTPARLRVAIRPTRLMPWEERAIMDLVEQLSVEALGGKTAALGVPRVIELLTSLLRASERLHLMRVWVESERAFPAGIMASIVDELHAGKGRGEVASLAGAVEREPLKLDDEHALPLPDHAAPLTNLGLSDELARLPFLFTRGEASRLFRMPVLREPLQGLPCRSSRLLQAPPGVPGEGHRLGRNGRRAGARPLAMPDAARFRHLYAVGQTGTGKSTFLHSLIMQDIEAGRGVCLIDPHGDLVELVMATMPDERVDDVALLDPLDLDFPVGINPLDIAAREDQDLVVEEFLTLFGRLWPVEFLGPIFQYNIRNTLLLMMHLASAGHVPAPATILSLPRYIRDKSLIRHLQDKVTDPQLVEFVSDYLETTDYHHSEMRGYLISKFNVLLTHHAIRLMVGQNHTRLNIPELVAGGKIILVRLPTGELGEITAKFLGFLVLLKVQGAIMARASLPTAERTPFMLYVDEFQNYLTETLPILLAEGRKFCVGLTLANQFLGQLQSRKVEDRLLGALFGNVGTIAAFRVGNEDSELLARQLGGEVRPSNLVGMPNYEAFLRILSHDGTPTVVSLRSEVWPDEPCAVRAQECREASRARYARRADAVKMEIEKEARAYDLIARGKNWNPNPLKDDLFIINGN